MKQQAYAELADHFAETSEYFGKMADWHDVVSWRQTDAGYFRKLEGEMFAIALVYRRMAQGEARRMQMRRAILTSIVLVILMFVLVGGLPAVAQSNDPLATNTVPVVATINGEPVEATLVAPGDEQPPVVVVEPTFVPTDNSYLPTRDEVLDTFMKYSTVIMVAALLVILALFYRVAQMLALSVPQYAWESVKAGEKSLEKSLEQRVKDSETPIDDAMWPYLQKALQRFFDEADLKRAGTVPPQTLLRSTGGIGEKLPDYPPEPDAG